MKTAVNNYRTDPLTDRYDLVKTRHSDDMLKLLSDYLPASARVLEIGPGHGHFAQAARDAGLDYEGIEPSDFFREQLLANGFSVSDDVVPPIASQDSAYDLVYGSMFIENLPTSREAGDFAFEAFRVMKPNGVIALIFPNYLTWGAFFFDEHYTHSFVTTAKRVEHLLASQGFKIERTNHVLGWYWVEENLWRNIVRHAANITMWAVHSALARWVFTSLGLKEFHWKLRKTLFEAIIMIAQKPA